MKPKHRNENLLIQETNNETLVYDLSINKAYLLNETSAFIWQMCDGNRETSEITTALSKKFKQSADEDFVWLTIDLLKKEGLMADAGKLPNKFTANRREAIKRIGLTTMMALPLVTAITAPSAANAQSGAVCVVGADCSSSAACPGCQCSGPLVCKDQGEVLVNTFPCNNFGEFCMTLDALRSGICVGTCQS